MSGVLSSVAVVVSVDIGISNSALAGSLPLSSTDAAALTSSLVAFVNSKSLPGNDIITVYATVRVHLAVFDA
jgi:hypothetical protein